MIYRSVALLSALSAVAGKSVELPTGDIAASSKLGSRILSQARQLDGENFSWVAGYSLKFEKCATSDEYYGGYFGGEGGGGNDRQNFNGMYKQRLIHFKLCPTGSCDSKCTYGADYVVDMGVFVEAYIESKLDAQEYNCEMVRENCYCDDANDDEACEYQCYVDAGLDYCEENNNNNNNNNGQQMEEFQLEDAAECRKLEIDEEALAAYFYQNYQNNNGGGQNGYNYYGQQGGQNGEMELFVGPYCSSNGKNIFLGVFHDETCSYQAEAGIYEKFSYGQALPYSSESIISSECISCKEPQDANDQNNGDQQDEDEVLEICERLYEDAGKCESGLADGVTYYPTTYGCDFIKSLHAPGKMNSAKKSSSVSAAQVFAGLFAATTAIFGAVAFYFHKKQQRGSVDLSGQDGGAIA